jgi:signal transduction histidine kinase
MRINSESDLLKARLWREVTERNRYSATVHVAFMFVAFAFSYQMHLARPYTMTVYGLILLGNLYRHFIFKQIDYLKIPDKNLAVLYNFCMASIGIGWGLYWYDNSSWYGQFSIQDLFGFLAMTSLIAGAVPANSARPVGYLFLAISMASIPIYEFILRDKLETKMIVVCIIFYLLFHIYQLKLSYRNIRRTFENDLQMSIEREKLQTLINAVPGQVSFIDKNLRYVMANENAKTTFGRNLTDQHIAKENPESDFVSFVTKFMNGNKRTAISEVSIEMNPGKSISMVSIQKIDEPIGGAVIVEIPIDELIEVREKVKVQEAKSFYTAKLVSLGEMAAGIAHEINNPLAIILASSDQIMRNLKSTEPPIEKIETLTIKIQYTVERISLIIKSLRALSRNGEKDPHKPVHISNFLDPSLEISRQRFSERNIKLDVIKPDEDIICLGQEIQLSQVIMNLISNAYDAALDGPEPKWVRLEVNEKAEHVDICVIDSGLGIPEVIKHKIMDPFFTTKPINRGTGLGLSISKSIVDQHNGSLTLDNSAPSTTFIMRLKRVIN